MTEILHTNSFVILVFLCFFVLKWCGVGLKHKGDEGDTKNTMIRAGLNISRKVRAAMCGRMSRWPMKTELSFIGNWRKRKRSASVLVRG